MPNSEKGSPRPRVDELDARGLEQLAWVLARAFRDNPLNVAVVGGSSRRRVRSNRPGMRTTLHSALGRAMVLVSRRSTDRIDGGLVALPPHAWPLPPPPLALQLRTLLGQGLRVARAWGRVFEELGAVHPVGRHWYLAVLGVEPDLQGLGSGGALVRHFLAQVDSDALPVYLETDRSQNVGLYERFGFRIEDEMEILGVSVWRMWRDARSHE